MHFNSCTRTKQVWHHWLQLGLRHGDPPLIRLGLARCRSFHGHAGRRCPRVSGGTGVAQVHRLVIDAQPILFSFDESAEHCNFHVKSDFDVLQHESLLCSLLIQLSISCLFAIMYYLEILIFLKLLCQLIQQPFDLVILGGQLGPMDAFQIIHFLC